MSNHEIRKDEHEIRQLDAKGLRDFGLLLGGVVIGVFGILIPLLHHRSIYSGPGIVWLIGGILIGLSLIFPQSLNPVYHVWMRFGILMSKIETPLVLGIVFYLVMVPMGFFMRMTAKDPMRRKLDRDLDSYRVSSQVKSRISMERPF